MAHADASNFAAGVTKREAYEQVLLQAQGLVDGQRNWVRLDGGDTTCDLLPLTASNLANAASLLWHAFQSLEAQVNWAGFYTVDTRAPSQLILGPFQGKVACQTIAIGRGVCGAAAAKLSTVRVDDVDAFPGHIACDSESRSEIVVPIVAAGRLVAIIDVDCAALHGFDDVDRTHLEQLADLLARSCDWP